MTDPEYPGQHSYPGEEANRPVPQFEASPLTRIEYIQALVHLYRGELSRSTQWRLRLDNTTNWAIFSVMGLVTFSLGDPTHSHVGVLAGMVLVLTFLGIEARRFRFFDVWRARVRMLEENFYGPILRRDMESPVSGWGKLVADDLLHPTFKITYHQALRTRLLRNYMPIFTLLLLSWVMKLLMHPQAGSGVSGLLDTMRIGPVPWWASIALIAAVYGYLGLILILVPRTRSPQEEYWGKKGTRREELSRIDI
jgi:uncharacterized membrane protein